MTDAQHRQLLTANQNRRTNHKEPPIRTPKRQPTCSRTLPPPPGETPQGMGGFGNTQATKRQKRQLTKSRLVLDLDLIGREGVANFRNQSQTAVKHEQDDSQLLSTLNRKSLQQNKPEPSSYRHDYSKRLENESQHIVCRLSRHGQ